MCKGCYMPKSPILAPAREALDPHAELTQAHDEAARKSALLYENLAHIFQIDMADAQRQALQIGTALHKVACAERACGSCLGLDHTFDKPYQEMLKHHRLAFIGFERLSRELESNLSPRCSDLADLAADIKHHLNMAEQSHQKNIGATGLKKAQ